MNKGTIRFALAFSYQLSDVIGYQPPNPSKRTKGYMKKAFYTRDYIIRSQSRLWNGKWREVWEARPKLYDKLAGKYYGAGNVYDFPDDWIVSFKGTATLILPSVIDKTKIINQLHFSIAYSAAEEPVKNERVESRFELLDL